MGWKETGAGTDDVRPLVEFQKVDVQVSPCSEDARLQLLTSAVASSRSPQRKHDPQHSYGATAAALKDEHTPLHVQQLLMTKGRMKMD